MSKNLNKFFLLHSLSLLALASSVALADGLPGAPGGLASAATGGAQQPSMLTSLFPMVAMFVVVYFMMIRPQQKRMREQQDMMNALQEGDEVVTASGIFGKVAGITEKVVTLEISKDVRVKVIKSQVTQVLKGGVL